MGTRARIGLRAVAVVLFVVAAVLGLLSQFLVIGARTSERVPGAGRLDWLHHLEDGAGRDFRDFGHRDDRPGLWRSW